MWTNKIRIKGDTISEKEENAVELIRAIYKDRVTPRSEEERVKIIINEYNRLRKEPLPDDLIEARIFKMEQKNWTLDYYADCINKPLYRKIDEFEKRYSSFKDI